MEGLIVRHITEADFVVFTGGEDVTPSYYNEPRHPKTHCNPRRDDKEVDEFIRGRDLGKKMVGICRGSQLLCAMSGGKLVQDQEIQPYYHQMETEDGKTILVSSTHHQAQWPWNLMLGDFELLGWTYNLSRWHQDGRSKEIVFGHAGLCQWGGGREGDNLLEVEVCLYRKTNCLCIQPHPEFYFGDSSPDKKESIAWFQNILNNHMEGSL